MKKVTPKQNEIWLVEFEPQIGSEIMKTRPAVVLTNDVLEKLTTRIIVPIRDFKLNHDLVSFFICIEPDKTNNLVKKSTIDCSQVKSFDILRFKKKLGKINDEIFDEIINAVNICIEK